MRADATITSRRTLRRAVGGPSCVGQGRGEVPQEVERALVGPLDILEAEADGLERRDLEEEGRQGAVDVVGLAAVVDLLVGLSGEILAQLGCDAEQLAAVVVDDAQEPDQRLGRQAGDVRAGQILVGRRHLASLLELELGDELAEDLGERVEGREVAVEASSLVDLAAVAASDAFGLLHHAALTDPRLAADHDDRSGDFLAGRDGTEAATQDIVDDLLLAGPADEAGDGQRWSERGDRDAGDSGPLVDAEDPRDRGAERAGGIGPAPRLLAEVLHHRVGDRLGDAGLDIRQRPRLLVELRLHQRAHAREPRLGEGIASAEQFVGDESEAIEVGAVVQLVEVELLGGAVRDRADEAGLGRERRLDAVVLREAEVHQPGLEAAGPVLPGRGPDEDVGGFDVAMDDAVAVDVIEGVGQLQERVEPLDERARREAGDGLAQEELHGEERPAVELAVVVDAEAMGVPQRRERAELALEAAAGRAGQGTLHEL